MKRVAILAILCAGTAFSQTYTMNIRMRGGGTTSIPLNEIRKLTFSSVSDVQDAKWSAVIRTFTLLQNHPNPFNPATTITYELPKPGEVEVRVFNVTGRLVRTLSTGVMDGGRHEIGWDGRDDGGGVVASGLYFCQVVFEDAALTSKMLLLK